MRVLAIDLGTKTGFTYNEEAGILHAGTHILATAKEITQWHKCRLDRRLDMRPIRLYQWLMHRLSESKPQVVIFEDVQFASTTLAVQLWATLRGALWLACHDANVFVDCVAVGTLKKFATGNGNATKDAMKASALKVWPDMPKIDDNGIDAFWLHRWAQVNLERKYEQQSKNNATDETRCCAAANQRHPKHRYAHRLLAPGRIRE